MIRRPAARTAAWPSGSSTEKRVMSSPLSDQDRAFLARAVHIAERGRGFVHPNPVAGCVLVREGAVVGEGFHGEYGGAHAEVNALKQAGSRAGGATAYVSLEPCAHFGKTPPCSAALAEAGVERVIYGGADPGPGAGGRRALAAAGVEIVGPVFGASEAARQNPVFFHVHATGIPYVAVKLAMTLDGMIAARQGERTAITGAEAARGVQALRREFDAIMVGGITARIDDPLLTVRSGPRADRPPARVVLDTQAALSPTARMFEDVAVSPVHVFVGLEASREACSRLESAGATVHPVPLEDGRVALPAVFATLWSNGICSVLCEGGGVLTASLLNAGRVQRLHLFIAPLTLGPDGVPAFPGVIRPDAMQGWTPVRAVETFGQDVLVTWDRDTSEDP